MESRLEHVLTHSYKTEMVAYLKSHPEDFEEAIALAISDKQPYSWRASWILWSCMEENDKRLQGCVEKMIDMLHEVNDSQVRELMMILQRMEINDELEGKLFDACISIWEKTDNKPSLRHNAFRIIIKICKKHPDLLNEIKYLTEPQYIDSLSGGVKRAVLKLMAGVNRRQ